MAISRANIKKVEQVTKGTSKKKKVVCRKDHASNKKS